MNRVESFEKFCEEYASAVCSVAGKVSSLLQSVTDYLSHLHPTFGIGGDLSVSVRLDFGEKVTSIGLEIRFSPAMSGGLAPKSAVFERRRARVFSDT